MPQFSFKARKRSGEVVNGIMDVTDRSAAVMQIERSGLFPVVVEAVAGSAPSRMEGMAGKGASSRRLLPAAFTGLMQRKRRPKLTELATFTQQLSNLLKSGMPMTVALNSMTHLESKGISPEVSRQLKLDVMEGKSLSDAMSKQTRIFSDLYVNMVRAGEQSGALQEVLQRLSQHYERFAEVQQKFVSAMIYPAIVACVGVVIIFFFMSYMLPKFLTIFQGMNIALPASTQMLVGISGFFANYWWVMILVVIAGGILFRRSQSTEAGRRKFDEIKLKLPVAGKVLKLSLYGQFARTLCTLLENGVPVLTALKITEQIIPNRVFKEAIAKTREDVTDGKTIAQPLARSQIFPQLMIDLLTIGEETGEVPGALRNIAETYENELAIGLRIMTNLIEPVMIILLALMVGFLLFSVLSAMFAVTSNIAR